MYDTVVVGVDGSEKAQEAVERAFRLAQDYGSEVHAITIVNTSRYGEPALSSSELILNELEDHGNKQLKAISEEGSERDVRVVTKCCHGNPSQAIIEYARENDVDLIILGSHGHGHKHPVIGSTASKVLHGTSCEVLIV